MSSQTVARRYASALADVITDRGEAARVQEELTSWENMVLANENLLEAFTNPTVPYDQKAKVLNELIVRTKVAPTTANLLKLLLKNQRFGDLPNVNLKLTHILDERAGVVSAEVKSARPVSENIKSSLQEKLGQLTGKRIRLTFETDETLLGGIVTRVGSTIYDGSVRTQLKELGEELAG